MTDYLEVWRPGGRALMALEGDRLTIGKADANGVSIPSDPTVSHLHAVIDRIGPRWCIRDMGSRNGTFLNNERVFGDRPLRHGDEVRVGGTRLVFRAGDTYAPTVTEGAEPPPRVTARERDVLLALCRPLFSGDVFTTPASTRQIAESLSVSEAAVKQHLLRLYDKFEIYEPSESRRLQLANEAVARGAVTLSDLQAGT